MVVGVGLGTGDEVVVPSFGGDTAAQVVREAGARPVFADIEPRSFCLDPSAAEAAVTDRTVAIAPVHLFGHPADMVCLRELAQRHELDVMELDEPETADLGKQVVSVDMVRRRKHAAYLDTRLTGVVTPAVAQGVEHAYSEYVVRVPGNGRPDRDAFKRSLRSRGVECYVPVKAPAHRVHGCPADVRLPESERAADETLALPLRSDMTKRQLQRVVSACNALGGLLLEPAC
jgi:dTDP-4-amino-4,6-dideoxygalactose transaminase